MSHGRWLIKLVNETEGLSSLGLRFDSDVTMFQTNVETHSVSLLEVYRVNNKSGIVKNFVGIWKQGRLKTTKEFIWERRKDLYGAIVTSPVLHVSIQIL